MEQKCINVFFLKRVVPEMEMGSCLRVSRFVSLKVYVLRTSYFSLISEFCSPVFDVALQRHPEDTTRNLLKMYFYSQFVSVILIKPR